MTGQPKRCLVVVASVLLIKNSIETSDPDSKNPVVTSQTDETTQTSVSQTEENTEQTDDMSFKYYFNLNVEKISAKDVYECSEPYTMPETINGHQEYYIDGIIDKESVYVRLQSPETNQELIGVYNFVNNKYSAITEIRSKEDIAVYHGNDYIIILSDSDEDENSSVLSYYDIKKNTSGIIYNDMWIVQRYNTGLTQNGYIMYNDCLYFNVYKPDQDSDRISDIYKYNFSDNELTLVRENAYDPMIINDSVTACFKDSETGRYSTIQNIEGDNNFSYDIEEGTSSLCAANTEIYGVMSPDGYIKEVKEIKSQSTIFSSYPDGRCIFSLDSSNDIIGFSDLDIHETQIPFVYDIKRNKVVEFDHLSRSNHCVYVKDNYGVISCVDLTDKKAKQVIFFQSKPQ